MATSQLSTVVDHLRRTIPCGDRTDLTDGQLLERFLTRRDEAAFAALVQRHSSMVWGVCRRVLSNHHDAEDAFQATFLVLVRKATSVRPREMVGNWLYGVAHQTALKSRATTAKSRMRERQVQAMPEPEAVQRHRQDDLENLLDHELSRLPDKYRIAIVLCDLEGRPRKEAARHLKIREGTLSSRLTAARKMLAKRLSRHGWAVTGGSLAALVSPSAGSAGVPTAVLSATIKTATSVVAGQIATSVIPAPVAALTERVLKTMLLHKLKTLTALLGALGLIVLGMGHGAYYGFAQQSRDDSNRETVQVPTPAPASKDAGKPDEKQSDAHYCWLVFGPKAQVRVLMRLKGDEMAVDRDGDGKFDGKGERFKSEKDCKDVAIADPDGKTSYVITHVHVLHVVPPEKLVTVRVHIRGTYSYPQSCIVQMADKPNGAPQAHFHGPLTVTPNGWRLVNRASRLLENGVAHLDGLLPQSVKQWAGKGLAPESTLPKSFKRNGPTKLYAGIATDGQNSRVAVCSPAGTEEGRREQAPFPKGIHPLADVEFPAKAGDPPLKKRYPLDQFCCDGLYYGLVQVPDEAGAGKAKVTFSFETWKGVKVAPTTVEIPIDDAQEKK
jgi:RNA polymerase sigma factor (sigma-70 family)